MHEASKSIALYPDVFRKHLGDMRKRILDIGAGGDPVTDYAFTWDWEQGNAEVIDELITGPNWDVVFASHSLEHMSNPSDALRRWFSLLNPDGVLIVIVPDEQLYEQGFFPSIFNSDHKATFSLIETECGGHPNSNFVPRLISNLEIDIGASIEIEYLARQDANYDYKLLKKGKVARALYMISPKLFWNLKPLLNRLQISPVDQTLSENVVAQICFILRRS